MAIASSHHRGRRVLLASLCPKYLIAVLRRLPPLAGSANARMGFRGYRRSGLS